MLSAVLAESQHYSDLHVRARLEAPPNAEVESAETLDGDGFDGPGAESLRLQVRIVRSGSRFDVDFIKPGTQYRDELVIATLINCPVRISNLEQIETGKHLLFDGDYWLSFPEKETKTGEPFTGDLPASLPPWMEGYLNTHRPALLARGKDLATKRLWVDRWGQPMREHSMRDQINLRTRAAFGRNVWPHLFRHCALTGLVDHAPEQIAIAPDLLGHSSLQTTQKHYVLARGTRAHQAAQRSISEARQEARKRFEHKRRKGLCNLNASGSLRRSVTRRPQRGTQPALAPCTFTGRQETLNPVGRGI
jgi:hypothetical protein